MKINFYIISILFSSLFTGCAYYNTFYNAEKSFKDAEALIDKTKKTKENDIPQQAKKLLSQSIEKSQKILDQFPNSKYIDDSYFLIGKSSFIKGDYNYSEFFFRKLITEHKNSNLYIDSKLWLSYTLLKKNLLDSSLFYINTLNNEKKLNDNNNFLKFTILAELDLLNNNLDDAYNNFEKSIKYINKDSKKSSIYERLVRIAEDSNNKTKAIYFLDKLNYYSQTEDLKYESKLKWLKYNREMGKLNIVNIEIDKLLSRSDYEKIYLSLELEKVKIQLYENNFASAKDNLLYIVDNNSKKKETAESYYLLGLYYLRNDWDLDKAKEYFSKVKLEYSRSIYLDNAIELKNTIEKYQGLNKIFNSQQSGDTSIVEFTIDEEEIIEDDLMNLQGFNMSGLGSGLSGQYSNPKLNIPGFEEENLSSVVIKGTIDSLIFAMGEILYFDFQQLDSAQSKFEFLYKNYPESKFTPQAMYILSNTVKDSILWKDKLMNEYVNSNFSKVLRGEEIQIESIDLIEKIRDNIWDSVDISADLAAQKFISLSDSLNDSKSLYSAAYLYDYYLNDIDSSIMYYKQLIDSFPNSNFIDNASNRLQAINNSLPWNYLSLKEHIAIIPLEGIGLTKKEVDSLSNDLLEKLIFLNKYNVIDLDKQKSQHSGCNDTKCVVEFGKLLKVNYIIIGNSSKLGNTYSLDARLINIKNSEALSSATFSHTGEIDRLFSVGIDEIANKLYDIEKTKIIASDTELDLDIALSDTIFKEILPELPPILENINNIQFPNNNDSIKNKLLDKKLANKLDTLKYIKPLKDEIIEIDYQIEKIIHWIDHIIKKGESLEKISIKYFNNTSMVDSIFNWNLITLNNDKNFIYPYEIIKIKTDKLISQSPFYTSHTVLLGETLWSISKEILNDPYAWILIYNDNIDVLIKGKNNLQPGMNLKIRDLKNN